MTRAEIYKPSKKTSTVVLSTLYDFSGKVLSTYQRFKNPKSSITPQTTVLTMMHYDAAGRMDSLKKRLNDNINLQRSIAVSSYDELGQQLLKRLNATGASAQLESLNYEYNIRGWLKSINKAYLSSSTGNFFGMDLSYDWGFSAAQYNGNITGVKWKGFSDGIARAQGFSYDNNNRLISGYFTQQNTGSTSWTNDKVDLSVSGLSYDANGNILTMKQVGLNGASSSPVDRLKYGYTSGSNKLNFVADSVFNPQSKLGDFKEIVNNETQDYWYDEGGNLIKDKNKGIDSILYNFQNLPRQIILTGKGVIDYVYDAGGNKLRKTVTDYTVSPVRTTVTDYLGSAIYEQDSLSFIPHEEGRIRVLYRSDRPLAYTYDYFLKDHLGNTRMVLGTKSDTSIYAATMETAAAPVEEQLFTNLNRTAISTLPGYPTDNSTSPNNFVAKTNANSGQKIGPSKVLRVMAGDTLRINATAVYRSNAANTSVAPTPDMVSAVLNAFTGVGVADGIHNAGGVGSPLNAGLNNSVYDALKQKDPNQNLSNKPKSYLNFASFDDQFNLVDDNSGVRQVQGDANVLQALSVSSFVVKKTGFVYIYCSNESAEDVLFDNLVVVHNSGPLLEETHYYPFGLTMAGISSRALKGVNYPENKRKYNGNELQSKDFSDGSGLEIYDCNARTYDQQVGRFMQIDPLAESEEQDALSPYHFAKDDPITYNDPDGKCPNCLVGAAIGGLVDAGLQLTEIAVTDKKLSEFSFLSVAVSAGAGAISSGISSIGKIKQASTVVKIGIELATDAGVSTGSQLINDGEVSLKKTAIDVGAGQLIGRGVGALVEKKAAGSATAKRLKETVNREKNIARGKSNSVPKSQAKVADAEKKLDDYVGTRAAATAATASGATSTVVEKITEKKKKE